MINITEYNIKIDYRKRSACYNKRKEKKIHCTKRE